MKYILGAIICIMFAYPAFAGEPGQTQSQHCQSSVFCQRCDEDDDQLKKKILCERKGRRYKWSDDTCVKTMYLRRCSHTIKRQLKCWQTGGEWRDGMCRERPKPKSVVKVKTIKIRVPIPKDCPSEATVTIPPSDKWWWAGPGVFALGLYMSELRMFETGIQGKLMFALNDRLRVGGMAGYSFWQNSNVLLGTEFGVRLWKELRGIFSFNALLGGMEEGKLTRRTLLVGAGASYMFGQHTELGLQFVFGAHREFDECANPSGFVGGNLLTFNLYF